MTRKSDKPSPEAKALSLFLMAFKTQDPDCKEKAKRINKRWYMVQDRELSLEDYKAEVQSMLDLYGGYDAVVEKTVKYYIEKTGTWTLKGEGKYADDAQKVADRLISTQ